MGGVAAVASVASVGALFEVAAQAATAAPAGSAASPRVIGMVAKKFDFVPDKIEMALGETVIIELTAPEVPMGFVLADFKVRADVVPGKTTSVQFTADKPGTFFFACDVFCGSGHEDMGGSVVVT